MFAMYDDDGLNFRSTIDTLYTVQKVANSQRVKNDPYKEKDHTHNSFDSFQKKRVTQEAKSKYKQMLNLDTKVEIFHVEQVMSYNTTIVNDTNTIQECYDLMEQNKVQQLLIRADKGNHLKGMITKQEILEFIINNRSLNNIQNTPIHQIAQKNIITTDPITDIRLSLIHI